MRLWPLWLAPLLLVAACATPFDPRYHCEVEDGVVSVRMRSASWSYAYPSYEAPAAQRTNIYLWYDFNLDPDPNADTRVFGGLSDRGRLSAYFGVAYAGRNDPEANPPVRAHYVEVRGGDVALRRWLNRDGFFSASGSALDAILGGADDVEISLHEASGVQLIRVPIPRAALDDAAARITSLTPQLQAKLHDAVQLCAPEPIIVAH